MTIPPNNQPGQTATPKRETVSVPLSPLERRMHEDLRWTTQSPEAQQYSGKLLVIREKRIVAVGVDQQALLEQAVAREQCPWWEIAVYLVPPLEEFWEVPK
jgi:hypothetical protein